jgi:serine/threonine protein kinase
MSPAPQPPLTNADLAAMIPDLRDIQPLGTGGQKQVFRAMLVDQPIAVKVMQALRDVRPGAVDGEATTELMPDEDAEATSEEEEVSAEPVDVMRLRREVGILRRLDSPHVVRLVPLQGQSCLALRHHGNRFVVFAEELVDGDDLRTIFKRSTNPWPVREVLRLGHDITLGIKALSDQKVVHRDLSPGNIMRRRDGSFVILDLGLALDLNADAITRVHVHRTMWHYAPEVLVPAMRNAIDERTDLFTLGLVMFQALTGQHPIRPDGMRTMTAKAEVLMSECRIRSIDIPPQTPERLEHLIHSLLHRDMTLRPRTCQRVLDELAAIAALLPEPA